MSSQGPAKQRKLNDIYLGNIHSACLRGQYEVVLQLLRAGVDVNEEDFYGRTPLWSACHNGHLKVVKLLLKQREIDINHMCNFGRTPLLIACWKGHLEIVTELLENGANVNQADKDGVTPLTTACGNGRVEVVKELLKQPGIKVNQANEYGSTPLYIACEEGHEQVVKALLSMDGIDINQATKGGFTPLYVACHWGHLEVVKLLLRAGADPYRAAGTGERPVDVARGHVKRILERWLRSRERIFCKRLNLPADIIGEIQERIGLHYVRPSYHQYVNE